MPNEVLGREAIADAITLGMGIYWGNDPTTSVYNTVHPSDHVGIDVLGTTSKIRGKGLKASCRYSSST